MKVVDSKKLKEIRKAGGKVRRIGERKTDKLEKKVLDAPKQDPLSVIAVLLRDLALKENPIPIANVIVRPSEVTLPGRPKILRIDFVRNKDGVIDHAVPIYEE